MLLSRHSRGFQQPKGWSSGNPVTCAFKDSTAYGQATGRLIASGGNGTLDTGVTSDLATRTWQHRERVVEGFTRTYQVHRLAWHELHGDMFPTIVREKRIKKWNRAWKIELIEKMNPCWNDLWCDILGQGKVAGFPLDQPFGC